MRVSRVVLNHDFSELIGHHYTISYKVKLPELGSLDVDHWVGFVLEDRKDGRTSPWIPPAYESKTNFCVLIHPQWQVGEQVLGARSASHSAVFAQSDAAGPYQVVVRVDETVPGSPRVDLDVNGMPILTQLPLRLGVGRFLGFQTFVLRSGLHGWGYVYDLCLSVDSDVVRHPGQADSSKPPDSRRINLAGNRPRGSRHPPRRGAAVFRKILRSVRFCCGLYIGEGPPRPLRTAGPAASNLKRRRRRATTTVQSQPPPDDARPGAAHPPLQNLPAPPAPPALTEPPMKLRGMMSQPSLSLLAFLALFPLGTFGEAAGPVAQSRPPQIDCSPGVDFATPPDDCRPWVYYFVGDANDPLVTPEGLTRDRRR